MAKKVTPKKKPVGTRSFQADINEGVLDVFKIWCAIHKTSMTEAVADFMVAKAATVTMPGDPPAKPAKKSK